VAGASTVFFEGAARSNTGQGAVSGPASSEAGATLIEDLVYANRILADQGVVDGFGHVSARHDKMADRFLMSRSIAPAQVTAKDILMHDLNGNPVDAGDRRPYLERFIHAAVYRARPDVKAVVHSHSPSVIPFGVTGIALRPIYHMSAFLGEGTPIFDTRRTAGMTDMLVRDNKLADALAQTLGSNPVVLMRGHGSTAAGASIQQAVYRAIYTEMNARLQMQAAALGTITFLSAEEASKAEATLDGQLGRAWELWKGRIGKI
jgi:ribulose-5-phosphate 4-epimerase/fuculose-1-phosphate aldolase